MRLRDLIQRPLEEGIPLPAIDIVHDNLTHKLILSKLGEQLGPDEPVHASGNDDGEADDAVDPVGEGLVDVLAILRGHKGGDDEVDVAEHEEYDDGEAGADGGVPVPGLAVEVEVDEAGGDEAVDDGEGIRDEAGDC